MTTLNSNETETLAEEPLQQLVIELIDQRASNYKLDADASEDDKTTSLTAPRALKLMNKSRIVVYEEDPKTKKTGWRLIQTRYIKGCDLIRVDEQDAAGYKPNPAVDVIWMKDGKLIINNTPENRAMFNYLTKGFNGNVDMETGDKVRRPEDAPDQVRIINTAKSAKVEENKFDQMDKVIDYLRTLKYTGKGGKTEYNEDALEFLCNLFQLSGFDHGYGSAEAWVAVRELAVQDAKKFLDTIASKRSLIESDVRKSVLKGVVKVSEQKAVLGKNNKVLVSYEKYGLLSDEERIGMLVDYFSNPENSSFLENIRVGNRAADIAAATVME